VLSSLNKAVDTTELASILLQLPQPLGFELQLPVNFHKPVAVDTGVYKDYVGQYEWRPGNDVETVSLKGRKLWTKQGEDVGEYLPWVQKGSSSRVISDFRLFP